LSSQSTMTISCTIYFSAPLINQHIHAVYGNDKTEAKLEYQGYISHECSRQ